MYEGLATVSDRLYATDFHNARVDVFDASFKPVPLVGGFTDAKIPKGWAPFGIQALNGNVFVTYAQQDKAKANAVAGGGLGYVDEFSPDGALIARVASKGKPTAPLNAPWGLAMAPANFGAYSGDLLVGNFGNGRISAYQPQASGKWAYKGQVRTASGAPIADRRPVGDRLRQRRLGRADDEPVLPRRPDRPDARALRLHRRGVKRGTPTQTAGGATRTRSPTRRPPSSHSQSATACSGSSSSRAASAGT